MVAVPESCRSGALQRLYGWAAIVAALVVFAGFAPTYYLKAWFGTPTLVHVHGLVMSVWFVVFATQVWLVESHRIRLHRTMHPDTATDAPPRPD